MRALAARLGVGGIVLCGIVAVTPRVNARPAPTPVDLLATVAIGPVATLRDLQAYLESIAPGAGEGLSDRSLRRDLAQAVGVSSLDGVDPASWMHLLVVSTPGSPEIGLLARVENATVLARSAGKNALIKQGWAVLGSKRVIDRVGGYAIGTLAAEPAPQALGGTVYVSHVLARYRRELDASRKEIAVRGQGSPDRMMQTMASAADGVIATLGDIERVTATLEVSRDAVALDLALTPKPRSRLAAFVAVQRPSDYALLDKLPASSSANVVAGHLEMGPYRDGLIDLMAAFYGAAGVRDMRTVMAALLKPATGEVAMTWSIAPKTGFSSDQLFGVSDAAAMDRAIAGALGRFKDGVTVDTPQMTMTIKADPSTPSHDGVALRGYDLAYDLSKAPPDQRVLLERMMNLGGRHARVAAFDAFGILVNAADAAAEARRAIDAARGKAARFTPSQATAAFLAGSRQRKDSFAMTLDLTMLIAMMTGPPPAAAPTAPCGISLGFTDRAAHVRLAVPAANLRAAVHAVQP